MPRVSRFVAQDIGNEPCCLSQVYVACRTNNFRVPVLPPAEMAMPPGGFGNATGGVGRAENLIATGNFPSCKDAIAILFLYLIGQSKRLYVLITFSRTLSYFDCFYSFISDWPMTIPTWSWSFVLIYKPRSQCGFQGLG